MVVVFFVFFFKQKPAYEVRISDWSSDVCSSDLVPAADPRAAKKAEEAASLRDVTQAAADWFTQQLGSSNGAPAREYLAKRGISEATRKAFGFGLAPDSRSALKEALKKFPTAMLVEAGMLIAVEEKQPHDRFRGRLMITHRAPAGDTERTQ